MNSDSWSRRDETPHHIVNGFATKRGPVKTQHPPYYNKSDRDMMQALIDDITERMSTLQYPHQFAHSGGS